MEIRINKEIKDYHESLFMGLSMRQFMCSLGAVGAAVGIYFGLKGVLDKETVSWLCIVCAAPLAAAGFFNYNGMNFEQFVVAYIYSEFLCSGVRTYKSENYIYEAYKEVLKDVSVRKEKNKKGKKKNPENSSAINTD
ncbi:MAG: PrgI family protein [Clostridia bacterium]|nr:PrgI family protein [Clostridia bacterium]MBR3994477.1 PrgI family protein [Clostridia bacterium]MEE0897138.1 PrgI family protein [Acutalibacteraceae bacterium]